MIDPTDLLNVYRQGDEGVLPTPTGGELGRPVDADIDSAAGGIPAPIARVFDLSIPTTERQTVDDRSRPDYWVISLSTAANGGLSIWLSESPAGPPVRLLPGGEAVLPGTSRFLTLESTGSSTATATVLAVRGYEGVRIRYGA